MFRARSSALLLVAACGGAQKPSIPSCPEDRTVTLAVQEDVDRFASCTRAAGIRIRTGAALDLRAMKLVTVTGDVMVGPTVGLEELALTSLREVGGTLRVESNSLLRGMFLPELAMAGSISVAGNAAVVTVSVPRLATVRGNLALAENGSLEIADLSSLVTIGKDLVIADNPLLNLVELGKLTRVGSMRIEGNRALGELQTGVPSQADGDHE